MKYLFHTSPRERNFQGKAQEMKYRERLQKDNWLSWLSIVTFACYAWSSTPSVLAQRVLKFDTSIAARLPLGAKGVVGAGEGIVSSSLGLRWALDSENQVGFCLCCFKCLWHSRFLMHFQHSILSSLSCSLPLFLVLPSHPPAHFHFFLAAQCRHLLTFPALGRGNLWWIS